MKLSILIPHTTKYDAFLPRLQKQLDDQIGDRQDIEVRKYIDDGYIPIGVKRNKLLQAATGEYVAFIDSDDLISDDYIKLVMKGIDAGADCCSLTGIITEDGLNPKTFIHSIRYDSWYEKDNIYYRNTNHLNVVRASIAKQMIFPEKNQEEDHDYSKQLLASGLLKNEYWIDEVLYYYEYRRKK